MMCSLPVCTYVYVCACVCVCMFVYVCVHVSVHMCTHTCTNTHIHIHTHHVLFAFPQCFCNAQEIVGSGNGFDETSDSNENVSCIWGFPGVLKAP